MIQVSASGSALIATFRDNSGIPRVVYFDTTSSAISIGKGDSTTPTSFNINGKTGTGVTGIYSYSLSAAMGTNNIIHMAYILWTSGTNTTPDVMYLTFDCANDTFGTPTAIWTDAGKAVASTNYLLTGICVDSNNIPHVFANAVIANMGTDYYTCHYNNRIGGAWNASWIEVYGKTAQVNISSIGSEGVIDENNAPVVALQTSGLSYYLATGNQNDAASFSLTSSFEAIYSLTFSSTGNYVWGYGSSGVKREGDLAYSTITNDGYSGGGITVVAGVPYVVHYSTDQTSLKIAKYTGTWGAGSWTITQLDNNFNSYQVNRTNKKPYADAYIDYATRNTNLINWGTYLYGTTTTTTTTAAPTTTTTTSSTTSTTTSTTTAAPTSQIESVASVARTSISSVSGVALASIASVAGVPNS